MSTYTIKVDGLFYTGESEIVEASKPGAFNGGWSGKGPATVNGLIFGSTPKLIQGRRNLLSVLDRITNRMETINPNNITIQKV